MGLFDKIFPKKKYPSEQQLSGYFKTLTAYQPVYTSYEGGLYEMALTRAAISTFARHCSKLKLEVVGSARHDLANILQNKPNPFQTSSQFLARVATIYEIENNTFIVPLEDEFGRIVGFYPVLPSQVNVIDVNGVPYLQYSFSSGKKAAIEFEKAGLLVQHQYKNDFFGDSNSPLYPTMQVAHTQNQGIVNAIKNATTIRFMARLASVFNPKDMAAERKRFAEENLQKNDTSVMIFDNKYADVKQIESFAQVVNPKQQEFIKESVFEYFGTNEKILTNTYSESEWNAYYEGKIESFAINISQVLSNMVFTPSQLNRKNMIVATTNRLQYAENSTKIAIVTQLFDRGFLTHNMGLEIFNMSPIPDGDSYFIRREYTEVKNVDLDRTTPTNGEGENNGNDT